VTRLSYALQEAIVQACGTVFYWKQPLKALLARAGVSRSLIEKYEHERKFIMVRSILAELDERGEAGVRVQQQLVSELAAMPDVHDLDNRAAGLKALADLRKVAKQEGLVDDDRKAREDAVRRKKAADERYTALAARRRGLGELHKKYTELAMNADDPQGRGFDLQDGKDSEGAPGACCCVDRDLDGTSLAQPALGSAAGTAADVASSSTSSNSSLFASSWASRSYRDSSSELQHDEPRSTGRRRRLFGVESPGAVAGAEDVAQYQLGSAR